MKHLKKVLSSFIAIAMIMAMIQPGVFATDTTEGTSENRAKLNMVYMGEGTSYAPDDVPAIQDLPSDPFQQDDIFWIGLSLTNLKTMDEQTGGGTSHFSQWANQADYTSHRSLSGGVSNIAAGLEYASKYLEPVFYDTSELQDNYSSIMSNLNSVYSRYTDVVAAMGEDITQAPGREESIIKPADEPKIIYISMSTSQANPANKLFGFTDDLTDDEVAILAVPFKVKEVPPAGTKVIQAALNQSQFVIQTGTNTLPIWKSQWNANRSVTPDTNIKNHFDYTGDLDLFPESASRVATKLESTNVSYTLPAQLEGTALDVNKGIGDVANQLELTATFNEAPDSVVLTSDVNEMKKVSYYYGDAGKTDTSELTPVPDKLTTDMTGKTLYAVYAFKSGNTVMCSIGELAVSARQLSTITLDTETVIDADETTFGKAGNTYYAGKSVLGLLEDSTAQAIVVDLAYDNGDTINNIHYANFDDNNLALYCVDADGKLKVVDAAVTLTEGTNTFYVAEKGKTGSEPTAVTVKAELTVTGTKDKTNITGVTDVPANSLSYKSTDTPDDQPSFNFDDIVIETETDSGTTTEQKVSAYPADSFTFFYVDDDTTPPASYTGTGNQHEVKNKTDKYTPEMNGKTLYVVPKDDLTATPQKVGTLKDRSIASGTVTGTFTTDDTKYGDKLGDTGLSVTVTYDNGETDTFESFDDLADAGIKMRVVEPDTHDVVGDYGDIDKDTTLTPEMNGKHLQFYVEGGNTGITTDDTVLNAGAGDPTGHFELKVQKIEVKVTVAAPADGISKTYDKTTALETTDTPTLTVTTTDMLTEDQTTYADITATTADLFTYADANAGSDKAISFSGTITAAGDAAADFNKYYTLKLDPTSLAALKGTIEQKKITTIEVTVPNITQGDTANRTKTGQTVNLTPTNTGDAVFQGDEVIFNYGYEYSENDVNGTPQDNVTVTITKDATTPLTGAAASNYVLDTSATITGKGSVKPKNLDSITVTTQPKVTYTYPEKLDLTGMMVSLNYEGTTATPITWEQFIAEGGIITLVYPTGSTTPDKTITAADGAGTVDLECGAATLKLAFGGKETSVAITTNKKKIKLSDVTLGIEKKYNGDNTYSGTVADPAGVETADEGKLTLEFKATFADANASDTDKEVTLSDVTLTGDAAKNYEIEDDISSKSTGKINKADQDEPAAPKVKVDPKTNNIVPDTENGYVKDDTLEYSINGTDWVAEPNFENLEKGKEYTVQARKKGDDNHNPSPAGSAAVTTLKNHVVVYKVNSTTKLAEVYTDVTSVADDNGFNSSTGVLGAKPSRFKAYYTDKEGKTKIEYPFTLKAETELYMTQTTGGGGGGGGGGGSSVTVKFPESNLEGYVGETLTLNPTITGTTSKPTWKSTNETIATVDENGNVKLLKEGEVRITVNVGGVQKSVGITVKPAPDKTPAPSSPSTPTPTPAPLIDTEYTKPYASGYDDGTFLPDNNITRAELASMIARLINGDDIPDGVYDSSFPDVADDAWYNKYVGYLENYNVISGYEDGTYRPDNQVTRGELAAVITRAQKYDIVVVDDMFTDVTSDNWAKDSITTLATRGVVSGYADGTFAPYSPLTRAEAVTMINNVLAPSTAIVTFTPTDISGYWAESNIILAVNERQVNSSAEAPEPEVTPAPEETPAPDAEATPAPDAEETPAPEGEATPAPEGEETPEESPVSDPGEVTNPTE